MLNARQVKWRELVNPATTRCFMQSSSLSLLGLSIQGKMLFFDKYQQGVEQMADVSRKAYLLILSGRTLMVQKTLQALASQTCNMPNHPIVVVYLHLGPGRSTPGQGTHDPRGTNQSCKTNLEHRRRKDIPAPRPGCLMGENSIKFPPVMRACLCMCKVRAKQYLKSGHLLWFRKCGLLNKRNICQEMRGEFNDSIAII